MHVAVARLVGQDVDRHVHVGLVGTGLRVRVLLRVVVVGGLLGLGVSSAGATAAPAGARRALLVLAVRLPAVVLVVGVRLGRGVVLLFDVAVARLVGQDVDRHVHVRLMRVGVRLGVLVGLVVVGGLLGLLGATGAGAAALGAHRALLVLAVALAGLVLVAGAGLRLAAVLLLDVAVARLVRQHVDRHVHVGLLAGGRRSRVLLRAVVVARLLRLGQARDRLVGHGRRSPSQRQGEDARPDSEFAFHSGCSP